MKQITSILSVSTRTIHKIIARASLACSLCNWNQATGDIHHIIEISEGGSNDMSNLIYVCPNCHRCIHQLGDKFKTKEDLYELSLDKTFPNWLEFYNIKSEKKIEEKVTYTKQCLQCNDLIPHQRMFCSPSCGAIFNNNKRKLNSKYTKEMLLDILLRNNCVLTKCGKELNMSDNAFRKQCIKHEISILDYKKLYKRSETILLK